MRIFTISDIHIDYKENRRWLFNISTEEYKDDILILAGDITDDSSLVIKALVSLKKCFRDVLFVPGNHDLWVHRNVVRNSLENFNVIRTITDNCGVIMEPVSYGDLSIVPLFGWYDYSFGDPSDKLREIWFDYLACKWPDHLDEKDITRHFTSMNEPFLDTKNEFIISFSHFMPRVDIMPSFIPEERRILYPVLGTNLLEEQVRRLKSNIHIYGHTHVNSRINKDGIEYINNAYGYPSETSITLKELICVYEMTNKEGH